MKYCKTCKKLYFSDETECLDCKKKLKDITEINEPVRLCIVGGTERALLEGLLKDANIPFVEDKVYPQGLSDDIVTGYDVKLSNISLTVPFSALPKASELLNSVETLKNPIEPHLDEIKEKIESLKNGCATPDEKPMSPALRTTVKVITAILFLLLVGAVVIGTDKLTEFIKNLF